MVTTTILHPELVALFDKVRVLYPDLIVGEPDKSGAVPLTWGGWSIGVRRRGWPECPTFLNSPNNYGIVYEVADSHAAMLRAFARQMHIEQQRHEDLGPFPIGSLGHAALLQYWQEQHTKGLDLVNRATQEIDKLSSGS